MRVTVRPEPLQAWKSPLCPRELARVLECMLDAVDAPDPMVVELSLVGDAAMAEANARFLGCSGPTNILSFPAASDRDQPALLQLSLDTLRRECLLYKQAPVEHQLRLLAHGTAHLLGHDHGEAMDALEDAAFAAASARLTA